jgi:hypothetical protein
VKLRVWVEVLTVHPLVEDVVEVPDGQWTAMTEDEREQYKQDVFTAALIEVANGGCEEIEEGVEGGHP